MTKEDLIIEIDCIEQRGISAYQFDDIWKLRLGFKSEHETQFLHTGACDFVTHVSIWYSYYNSLLQRIPSRELRLTLAQRPIEIH
jgi:hypothetical protein